MEDVVNRDEARGLAHCWRALFAAVCELGESYCELRVLTFKWVGSKAYEYTRPTFGDYCSHGAEVNCMMDRMVADDVVRDDSLISIESLYYLRLKRAVIPNLFWRLEIALS